MAHKLPDEILKEILSPVLNVDDESFAKTYGTSPFALKSYSNSDVLLVCKRWLRVATPLLYHVVILRSMAQTQALAHVLKKNRELGLFIKKIRLEEGGFGASMHKIIVAAPNIKDIFLSLITWSGDSVAGLCKGLPLMDPSRVILQDDEHKYKSNSPQRQLITTLCECFKTWRNLKTIDLPYNRNNQSFIQALIKSPSIESFYAQPTHGNLYYFRTLAELPSLRAIIVRARTPDYTLGVINGHPKLMTLIQYEDPPSLHHIPSSSPANIPSDPEIRTPMLPNSAPMSSVSADIQDKIWSQVLEFALEVQLRNGTLDHIAHFQDRTRGRLPLVSKQFRVLAIPYLYRFPIILTPSALTSFANQLIANPSLAQHIRSLFVFGNGPSTTRDMYQILSRTSALVELCSEWVNWKGMLAKMDWDGFNALAKSSGSTLLTLHNFEIDMSPSPQSPSVFNGFVKLRSLWWKCKTAFVIDRSQISCTSLMALERIHFEFSNESFIQVLSLMELPSLLHVVFSGSTASALPFLHKHGFKIRTLDLQYHQFSHYTLFDMCPNMEFLSISASSGLDSSFFRCSTENNKLAKIKLEMPLTYPGMTNPFKTINLDDFKALNEIQSMDCKWPTTERKIAKDSWHVLAEILLKWGVKLTDANGRHWRPRLKPQRRL